MAQKVELRTEVDPSEVITLEAMVKATGKSRSDLIREILAEWSVRKEREATFVCRMHRVNALAPEFDRITVGNTNRGFTDV